MSFFTDENYFNLDGLYDVQNDRKWRVSRKEAEKQADRDQKTKFAIR